MPSEHTPGPWEYGGQSGKKRAFIFAGKTPAGEPMFQVGLVAQDYRLAGGDPEANGLLIAAAPELLEAAENLLHAAGIGGGAPQSFASGGAGFIAHADQIAAAWRELKAKVLKARGETDAPPVD